MFSRRCNYEILLTRAERILNPSLAAVATMWNWEQFHGPPKLGLKAFDEIQVVDRFRSSDFGRLLRKVSHKSLPSTCRVVPYLSALTPLSPR